MKVIFLTDKSTAHKGKMMVNSESITLVRQAHGSYGDEYAEVYIGENKIDVEEDYQEVVNLLKNKQSRLEM